MFGFGRESEHRTAGEPSKGGHSRRTFLKWSGATLGLVVLGGSGVDAAVNVGEWVDRTLIMKPEQRFDHYKMADFTPLYKSKQEFEAAYGTYMPYDDVYDDGSNSYFDNPYWSIYAFMDTIASGNYDGQIFTDNSIFDIFRDGWGDANLHGTPGEIRQTLKLKALHDALERLANDPNYLVIDPNVDPSLYNSDHISEFMKMIVTLMPAQFLFGAHTIHIFPGDGGDMYNTNGGEINIGDASVIDAFVDPSTVTIGDFDADRSHAYVSATHELGHSTSIFFGGDWDNDHIAQQPADYRSVGKRYVRKEDYLHYLTVKMQAQKEVADAYFGGTWEQAQTFKDGAYPMILGGEGEQFINWDTDSYETVTMDSIALWEKNMTEAFGTQYAAIPQDRQGDVSWRFNRYVHSVGSVLYHNPKQKDKIFGDSDMTFAINRFFGELQHYFVGPVQRANLGLAGNSGINLPVAENSVLTQQNMKVEAARAKAFYHLPPQIVDREIHLLLLRLYEITSISS